MKEKLNSKNLIVLTLMIIIAVSSIFGVSKMASSPEFHKKTIESLDDKKIVVMEITAATAGTATALAAIPGDATTPIANQILKLSSYLIIVIGAIFLEKILLTLTGYVTFTFLIPTACILFSTYMFLEYKFLKNLAIKLAVFGVIIFMVVPLSVKISNLVENTYKSTIDKTLEQSEDAKEISEKNENKEQNNSGFSGIISNIKEGISNVGDNVSKAVDNGKQMLSRFVDAIAILLITSCVIPIIVFVFLIWIVKIIFGIDVSDFIVKKDKKLKE